MPQPLLLKRTSAFTGGAAATPTYQAEGTGVGGTGGITVSWPTHATDDLGILGAIIRGDKTGGRAITNWTHIGEYASGTSTTDVRLDVYYRIATSASEGDVSIASSGNFDIAQIHTFRGAATVAALGSSSSGATASVTMTSGTTGGVNRHIFGILGNRGPLATDQITSWTNANLTSLTDRGGIASTAGADGGIDFFSGTVATASAVGSTTATMVDTVKWAGIHLEIAG